MRLPTNQRVHAYGYIRILRKGAKLWKPGYIRILRKGAKLWKPGYIRILRKGAKLWKPGYIRILRKRGIPLETWIYKNFEKKGHTSGNLDI